MTEIKMCGITNLEDARAAAEAGADALGFVFAGSPRRVEVETAARIASALGGAICLVGVFVDEGLENVNRIAREVPLDLVQLHGAEDRIFAEGLEVPFLKAFRAKDASVLGAIADFAAEAFLLDAFVAGKAGGTATAVDDRLAGCASGFGRLVLAGGLRPENVAGAIRRVRPAAVDVSSGVEIEPGRKDRAAMRRFVKEVRRCDRLMSGEGSGDSEGVLFRKRSSTPSTNSKAPARA